MRVLVQRPVSHVCPYVDERDLGEISASWDGDGVELHALSELLDSLIDMKVTHEEYTERVRAYVMAHGGEDVYVVTTWVTAGFAVTVSA